MAQQQQLVLEFIEKVKRDNYRNNDPYYLDDDSAISTNRGNKLNRNAKYVRRGMLNSHALFQQSVDHAGYKRDVISINPQYYTPDGDVVEDEDDIDDEDEPLDENIYKDIKLEDLLAPLASAADLPSHPSLSQPYKEHGLEEMIKNAEDQLHKQQDILSTIKNIYTGFRGDVGWAPMGLFRDAEGQRILNPEGTDAEMADEAPDPSTAVVQNGGGSEGQSAVMPAVSAHTHLGQHPHAEAGDGNGAQEVAVQSIERTDHAGIAQANANGIVANGAAVPNGMDVDHTAHSETGGTVDGSVEDGDSTAPSHRMTTRRQANQRTPSPSLIPPIDPFFTFPAEAVPDARQGLPQQMADESTLAISTYVSKQEETVRQLRELHNGLLRALKMRQEVWKWTRAEGHVGEMSDNEDWVDMEEWDIDPRDTRIKYTKGQQEEDQVDEEEERRGKRVRRAGRQKE